MDEKGAGEGCGAGRWEGGGERVDLRRQVSIPLGPGDLWLRAAVGFTGESGGAAQGCRLKVLLLGDDGFGCSTQHNTIQCRCHQH